MDTLHDLAITIALPLSVTASVALALLIQHWVNRKTLAAILAHARAAEEINVRTAKRMREAMVGAPAQRAHNVVALVPRPDGGDAA